MCFCTAVTEPHVHVEEPRVGNPSKAKSRQLGLGLRVTAKPEQIVDAVAAHYGLSRAELREANRSHERAEARQVAMYALARLDPNLRLEAIAALVGRRDHSTVIRGIRRIERTLAKDGDEAEAIRRLVTDLGVNL